MGVTLSMSGFASFDQVHDMFTFQDFNLIFVFGLAVVLNMLGFFLLARNKKLAKKTYTSGTIPGSILFGLGWALTGACPSIALVQVGEGQLAALVTILGVVAGVWLYRSFASNAKIDTGVCGEE
jgi:uncharacterized membrane protein YedE/YeeE